jgi:hypothetical protein
MAFFVPPLGLSDDEGLDDERLILIQQYLKSAAEREQEEKEAETQEENADNKEGGTGPRAKGEEGSIGYSSSVYWASWIRTSLLSASASPDVHARCPGKFSTPRPGS